MSICLVWPKKEPLQCSLKDVCVCVCVCRYLGKSRVEKMKNYTRGWVPDSTTTTNRIIQNYLYNVLMISSISGEKSLNFHQT